jgi:hypothetical protein
MGALLSRSSPSRRRATGIRAARGRAKSFGPPRVDLAYQITKGRWAGGIAPRPNPGNPSPLSSGPRTRRGLIERDSANCSSSRNSTQL